jgi:DNA-directed RNA polymerase specialized sigma24 family protein
MPLQIARSGSDEPILMDPAPSAHEHFLSLLESQQRPLLKVCWAYGRTSHDRDDLLQEIIGRLWSAFGR